MYTIQILGEPQGKERPRFNRKTGVVYTPVKTKEYEQRIKDEYIKQGGKLLSGEIDVVIQAYFKIPKHAKKAEKHLMLDGFVEPQKKPDIDNIAKVVLDGLQSVAFADDKQVTNLTVRKNYDEEPKVIILISERGPYIRRGVYYE